MRYLKEITDDWKTDFRVPNHTYILENGRNGRLLGYIKENTTNPIMFNTPTQFFRKGRTFKELKK
jgi:hypothetical protein